MADKASRADGRHSLQRPLTKQGVRLLFFPAAAPSLYPPGRAVQRSARVTSAPLPARVALATEDAMKRMNFVARDGTHDLCYPPR